MIARKTTTSLVVAAGSWICSGREEIKDFPLSSHPLISGSKQEPSMGTQSLSSSSLFWFTRWSSAK